MKYVCEKKLDGSWDWVHIDTEEKLGCISDKCTYRVCLPAEGCHEDDICRNKTNECMSFSCDKTGSEPQCVNKSLLISTTCTHEICKDGKKELVDDYETVCTDYKDNLCIESSCVYDPINKTSECVYKNKTFEITDPCLNNTCDPATGKLNETYKCHDGLHCTEDTCTVYGDCKYIPIVCSDEIDMSEYPCFQAVCQERENEHKCLKKLIPSAYIDVCGNCIIEKPSTKAESDSMSSSQSVSSMDFLSCTNAPPKPVLTEGLAAASIALIILAAVVVGAGLTVSGVVGTKALIDHAKNANDQSAHNNPLFEGNDAEMTNPTYGGGEN